MVEYLEELFGVKANLKRWDNENRIPSYLHEKRTYQILIIDGEKYLLLHFQEGGFNLHTFKIQIKQLQKYTENQIILCFDRITPYQRQTLFKHKISFIVPDSQVYIPELGIYFKERYQNKFLKIEKMTSMAQFVLLYLMYQRVQKEYTNVELGDELNLSAMNVSRAVQELEELELLKTRNEGRNKIVMPILAGRELYQKAKEHLRSPVQKKIYVKESYKYMELLIAGEEALAKKSMLGFPKHKVRAVDKKQFKMISVEDIVDAKWHMGSELIEIEVWRYDPEPLARNGCVDDISLALSLSDMRDERIEMELEKMIFLDC